MKTLSRLLISAVMVFGLMGALLPGVATGQVQVTSADPPSAPQGTLSLDVTISGNGFDSSAQVEFLVTGTTNPGGITVRKVKVTGPKKLIATIDVADTASIDKFDIQVSLSGGRKGKGTSLFAVLSKTNDPCAALNLDFPAFTFWRWAAQDRQIYVADASGQCIRPVFTLPAGLGFSWNTQKFSYPVAGTTDVGRMVWTATDNSLVVNLIYVFTFKVTGTSISNGTLELVYDSYPLDIWGMDLSRDGTTVYFNLTSAPSSGSSRIIAIDVDSGKLQEVFIGPPEGAFIDRIAVNDDGALVIRQGGQLFRIEPTCDNLTCAAPIETPSGDFPAASLLDNRLAYLERLAPTSSGCWLLQIIPDTGGPILNSAQPRYGRRGLTWYGGKVLTNGYKSPTRKGNCDSTGMITQIDPDTSAETPLVRGFDPDAR